MERQRFGDGVVVGGRVRADLLELADVVRLGRACGRERPERRDVLAAHIQKARADGREQPFVEARAVEIAAEVARLVGEVREGVRAVDNGLDPAPPRFIADLLHRKDLSGQVGDVAEVQDAGRRGDCAEQPVGEVVLRLRRYRKRDFRKTDPVAAHALFPGVEHAPVILVGGDHLVAGAQLDAELRDL
jgi:hypothetical protein